MGTRTGLGPGDSAQVAGSPSHEIGPRSLSNTQRLLAGIEGFVSVCGLAGGVYMATHATTVMSTDYLRGTWFHTWRWPGVALFFFVGVCPAIVATATLLQLRVALIGHVCVGLGLVAWILLEATWVVVSPGLQIAFGAIGAIIFVLGTHELVLRAKRSGSGWSASG